MTRADGAARRRVANLEAALERAEANAADARREHRAAREGERAAVVLSALAIAFLVIAGYPLLADRITPLGYLALIAALVLLIWWIIRDSRKL